IHVVADPPAKGIEAMEAAPMLETASLAMKKVVEMVHLVAPSQATVLILGESGTGKEVVADMIHRLSPRSGRPMVKVNCAAIPETLIESELFGYEKGAFTGAVGRKEGRFEAAHHSSIFLDEIGEVPPAVQVKLLRILQEGTFERLGSNKTQTVDVRIIAATNKDLAAMVREGSFREDLYWRLNVITIALPPLRDRKEDIPSLVQHFLTRFSHKNDKAVRGIESQAMEALLGYGWPGNVRELENIIERSVVLDRDGVISLDDLPAQLVSTADEAAHTVTIPLGTPLDEVERILMEETLKRTKGDKGLASKLLGISTRTLYRKMDRKD
ncbi:MAG TPA: sigma 54-interacting transcriptional regulator, partial [Deltaproteobacteria bacterium]|nr:sigma 54-interacting transcriptional regulator [Deltaproteobacteria bacterium]